MAFTLIIGPMKSGKSLELISRAAPHGYAKKKVVFVQPSRNVRDEGIRSRAGVNAEAISVDSLHDVTEDFHVIGIDEIHMFSPEDVPRIAQWIKTGHDVFVSGLDLDYRGKMPPIVRDLLELKPHEIINKVAVCDVCHRYGAQFSQILHEGKAVLGSLPLIVPEDGTYEYQARCRDCFEQA